MNEEGSPVSSRTRSAAAAAPTALPVSEASSPGALTQDGTATGKKLPRGLRQSSAAADGEPLDGYESPQPWGPELVRNEAVRDVMDFATILSNERIEALMTEGVVTYDFLMQNGGPVSVAVWQQYCRERKLPHFERGMNIQASFKKYHHGTVGTTAPETRDTGHTPSIVSFTKVFERYTFSGEPGTIPFVVWSRKFNQAQVLFQIDDSQARRTLPLILTGRAEALVSSMPEARLGTVLARMEEQFNSDQKKEAHETALKRMNLDMYVQEGRPRAEALAKLQDAIVTQAQELDLNESSPAGVAKHVAYAIESSQFAPAYNLIQGRNTSEKVEKFMGLLLSLDKNSGKIIGDTSLLYNASGPMKSITQGKKFAYPRLFCKFCKKRNHTETTCWKKHGKDGIIALLNQADSEGDVQDIPEDGGEDHDTDTEIEA